MSKKHAKTYFMVHFHTNPPPSPNGTGMEQNDTFPLTLENKYVLNLKSYLYFFFPQCNLRHANDAFQMLQKGYETLTDPVSIQIDCDQRRYLQSGTAI